MMKRRTLLAALAGLLAPFAVPAPVWANDSDPKAFVTNLASTAMDMMTAKGVSDQDRSARFRALFTREVDIAEIARFVLGRHWRVATTEQQQEFIRSFEDIVVFTWSNRFKDYGGDLRHIVTNVTQDGERGGFVVDSRVEREHQPPISLQWRLKPISTGLRVTDLVVEGSSMAIYYRSEYAAVIQRHNGKVEGLLSDLRAKLAELKSAPPVKAN
ncbi:phospholipid-binding protein MlaC [Magnetospirillum sp. SS-4]|uniref:MlaC/ttg2D family ABC transporter substrate-binding protein n=1 Tax=Magnetospirillum sp. SS-4 TaxID=2681465 RepID=UPI001383AD93|nr:ABC transporter substrate-binding protein [Magnetospirillum sp. SS-4]CAA7626119.1 ABC-type transport system [Magnetospirillum sp. SS-4]